MLNLQQLENQHLRLVDKIRITQLSDSKEEQETLKHLLITLQLVHDAEKAIREVENLKKTRENLNLQFSRLKFLQQENEESTLKNKHLIKKLSENLKLLALEINKAHQDAKKTLVQQLTINKETLERLEQESLDWQRQRHDISASITELAAEIDGLKQQMFNIQTYLADLNTKISRSIDSDL